MDNSKLRKGTIFIMAAVFVAGTISMLVPSSFAQSYEDPYAKEDRKKAADVNIQTIKCVNSNENVNGVDINEVPPGPPGVANAQATEENGAANGNGNGLLGDGINIDRNLVNICVNLNFNNQERVPLLAVISSMLP